MRRGPGVNVSYGWKLPSCDYPQMVRGSQRTGGLKTDQRQRETMGLPTRREPQGNRALVVLNRSGQCLRQGEGVQGRADRTQRVRWRPRTARGSARYRWSRIPGEPCALKGARTVREEGVGNVPISDELGSLRGVVTSEKLPSGSIAEATRWLPTSCAEVERVGESQSVTTFEKRSSGSIVEATRWLPTSFMPSRQSCIATFAARMRLKACLATCGSAPTRLMPSRPRHRVSPLSGP